MRLQRHSRPGITAVESALVYPVTFLLLLGTIIGGLGIYRYQEMASLARRAARDALVHGRQFAKDRNKPAATPTDIYEQAIAPHAVSLDLTKLTYAVSYNSDNWPTHTTIINGDVKAVGNTVTVTVSYRWIPEAFLGGITLTSTSTMPMSY